MNKVAWVSVEKGMHECSDWDIDREAFFSKKVMTYSETHGIDIHFCRKDNKHVGMVEYKQTGITYKWGVSRNDETITHWAEMPLNPNQ